MFPDTAAATEFMATVNTPEAADCLTTTYTAGIAGALGPRRNVDDVVLTGEAEIVVDDIAEMPWWDDLAGEVTVIAVTIPVEFNEGRSRSSAWTEFGFVQAGRAVAALEWGGEGGRGMTWGDLPLVRSKLTAIDSTFPAGTNPDTMAFDGSSLWIANIGDDTVSKMNPADGSRVDYPTESRPNDVVFDGTNIWVVSTSGQTLSKFDTADGTRVDYETDGNPVAVTWDGTNIWVANCAGDTVSKFDPADGTRVDYEVGADPEGIRGTRTGPRRQYVAVEGAVGKVLLKVILAAVAQHGAHVVGWHQRHFRVAQHRIRHPDRNADLLAAGVQRIRHQFQVIRKNIDVMGRILARHLDHHRQ